MTVQRILTASEPKPIVAGTDFSPESAAALAYAASVAHAERRKLHVVFVRSFLPREVAEDEDVDDATLRRRMLNLVAEFSSEPDAVEYHIVAGGPEREIVRIAEELEAGYIVVGTHGKRGLDRLLMGSVAESVLRSSPIPVLIVGPQSTKNAHFPWRSILLACDLETPVSEAARLAGALTVEKNARLTIFYVQPHGIGPLPEKQFERCAAIMSEASWLKLKPECLVRGGDVVAQISNMAKDLAADLLVLSAARGTRLLPHLHRGKIAGILAAAPCPILILSRQDRRTGEALISSDSPLSTKLPRLAGIGR